MVFFHDYIYVNIFGFINQQCLITHRHPYIEKHCRNVVAYHCNTQITTSSQPMNLKLFSEKSPVFDMDS